MAEDNTITIRVKMFHHLVKYLPAQSEGGSVMVPLEHGATLQELLTWMGIPDEEAKIVLINGQSQGVCTTIKMNPMLSDGDTVSIFPPVAGG
jgi:molybdopterin converting factor small subunit